jgi:hypothetical protein
MHIKYVVEKIAIIIEVIILSNHIIPVEVLINIEKVSVKLRPNSVDRLDICNIKRLEAETINVTTDSIKTKTILFAIRRSNCTMSLDRSEMANSTWVRMIFDSAIWLKTIPTIADWETNNGALINASICDVIDSAESPEICINMSPSC